jgi:hypothetical protein
MSLRRRCNDEPDPLARHRADRSDRREPATTAIVTSAPPPPITVSMAHSR